MLKDNRAIIIKQNNIIHGLIVAETNKDYDKLFNEIVKLNGDQNCELLTNMYKLEKHLNKIGINAKSPLILSYNVCTER